MKQKLKPIAISLCLMGLMSVPAFAATENTGQSQEIRSLQDQLTELKSEVAALKATHHSDPSTHKKKIVRNNASKQPSTQSGEVVGNASSSIVSMPNEATMQKISNAQQPSATAQTNLQVSGPAYLPQSGIQYLPIDVDVPGQSWVSTGPYIGVPFQYNGNDLIVNSPSVNQDVLLLKLRKNINQRLAALGVNTNQLHSHLLLSGMVEGQAFAGQNQGRVTNNGATTAATFSGVDLTTVGIDAYILTPSPWVSGLISLNYDNSIGSQNGTINTNARTQNSRIYVHQGYIVIGDFAQSPFYGTVGQMHVPFGQYSTSLVSTPLTKALFRTEARAVLLGVQQQKDNAFYGALYGFNGDSHIGNTSHFNNGGVNLGYKYDFSCFSGDVGIGALGNVADSEGMQGSGAPIFSSPVFTGFGGTNGTGNENLVHRVPGYDVRGLFSLGKSVDLIAEYVTASTRFNPNDATMKSYGAKPKALNTELAYTFQGTAKPISLTLGYGMTKEAVVWALPAQRYSLVANTSFWRNTLESLEFRHDKNYAISAASTSTGSNVAAPTLNNTSDNVVTAQFDIYF